MLRTACVIVIVFFAVSPSLPNPAAQTDTVELLPNVGLRDGSIRAKMGDACLLDQTQYKVEVSGDPLSLPVMLVRSFQHVDVYVRFGQRVTTEDGKITADLVAQSATGIKDVGLPRERPGTYFVAVANCSDTEAQYFISYLTNLEFFHGPIVTDCGLDLSTSGEFSLRILGSGFKREAVVTIGDGVPKKLKFKGLVVDSFSVIVAKGKLCRDLPGVIQVANLTEIASFPFFCRERCRD